MLLAGSLGSFGGTSAGAGFVEAYVNANGGCRFFGEQFSREVVAPQPFGRPVTVWNETDVSELEDVGLSCVAGPPPIMPGSAGARFKQAVSDFRVGSNEARRRALVADGEREMDERLGASQVRDRVL